MFSHMYINSLKIIMREKNIVFWLLLFPMLLAIFFKMGFSGLAEGESFSVIPVIMVEDKENSLNEVYKNILDNMGEIFEVSYEDEETAKEKVLSKDVAAYLYIENDLLAMMVSEDSINQNVVKNVVEKINEGVSLVMSGKVAPDEIENAINVENVLENIELSGQEQDFVAAWFYTILGMAAMYASMMGVQLVKMVQANQSATAMRMNLAPVSKMKGFSAIFMAGATIESVIMIIVYLYLRYIMNINFGDRQLYIMIVSVIGGITGLSVGALISVIVKAGDNMKTGICLGVSMIGSYLAGMMDDTMKYTVMQKAPVVEYINPAGILTDSYLKLFYYEDMSYFWVNVINLLVIMLLCMAVTVLVLRRQRYDSV